MADNYATTGLKKLKPLFTAGKSNHYNSNHDHWRAFVLKRRNAGKGSR